MTEEKENGVEPTNSTTEEDLTETTAETGATTTDLTVSSRATLVAELEEHVPKIIACLKEGQLATEEQKEQLVSASTTSEQPSDDSSEEPKESTESEKTQKIEEKQEPENKQEPESKPEPEDKQEPESIKQEPEEIEGGLTPEVNTVEKSEAEKLVDLCLSSEELTALLRQVLQELELNEAIEALDAHIQQIQTETPPDEQDQEETEEDATLKQPAARSYREVLQESKGTFVDTLKLDRTLLQLLQRSSVLNPDMVGKVMCRPNRPDKVRELMSMMMELGPQSVTAFTEALRCTQQHFLANILASHDYV